MSTAGWIISGDHPKFNALLQFLYDDSRKIDFNLEVTPGFKPVIARKQIGVSRFNGLRFRD
jgi:hypothetical protein